MATEGNQAKRLSLQAFQTVIDFLMNNPGLTENLQLNLYYKHKCLQTLALLFIMPKQACFSSGLNGFYPFLTQIKQ
jgi:hypothetical protein